jgi:hypothetical protein
MTREDIGAGATTTSLTLAVEAELLHAVSVVLSRRAEISVRDVFIELVFYHVLRKGA